MSRAVTFRLFACVFALLMAGCAQHSAVPSDSTEPSRLSYSVGPCYGVCPVYQVAIEADGATYFNGERHTLVEGTRKRDNQPETFQAAVARLAQWKPEMGATQSTVDCAPRATDHPQYTVIWTNAAFDQAVLEHDTGCHSEAGRQLTGTLRSLDTLLGIDAWVRTSIE